MSIPVHKLYAIPNTCIQSINGLTGGYHILHCCPSFFRHHAQNCKNYKTCKYACYGVHHANNIGISKKRKIYVFVIIGCVSFTMNINSIFDITAFVYSMFQQHFHPVYGKLHCPANTKHSYNICTTPAQRRRRWSNIVRML